ncbi:response regulator [Sphingobacterium chungjuense]|uniref:response regulator n=1 Tax=Sphingobacterium chungjuense TaxID=2675553 RepID=UPI00140C6453|nr:response regulator [Sphingobacterium chungjuense]
MNKKVLIFEDDSATAELSGIIVSQLGFEVAYRSETNDVLNDVLIEKPDLIIMDNWIPGQGGLLSVELLKQTSETSHIPIIFYSANTDFANLATSSKADAYLIKPFNLTDLEAMIGRLIFSNDK